MTCGEKIKMKRKSLGLTQKDLAVKLGLTFGTISKYEKNEISIPSNTLKLIADALNVSTDYLLGDTNIFNPKKLLEDSLSKHNLTDSEFNLIITDIITKKSIDISLLNSDNIKIKDAYNLIFNIYLDYQRSNPLEYDTDDLEIIEEHNNIIDNKFLNILKSIDKQKVVNNINNVCSTTDTPKQYPVLGRISAGLPILAVENIEGYSFAPSSKIQEGYDYFFLRVDGDSMNLKFPDGCLLLVQRQPFLEKNQIGVFRINGDDATVKRFKEENGLIILEPMSSNPNHEVQTYNPSEISIEIIGKVISYIGDVN